MQEHPFSDIPQRIFLDSSTLQTLQDYGAFLYENEDLSLGNRIFRDKEGAKKIEALRMIMQVAERAPFQFALSDNSFNEVRGAGRESYLRWAYDVLDHWRVCLYESGPPKPNLVALARLESNSFGYLGSGDRVLLRDALSFECDTFLTMENKLPKNGTHIGRELGIRVVSPIGMWSMLAPWAAGFR